MGLMGNLFGSIMQEIIPGVQQGHPALGPIVELLQNQPGGLAGLAEKFEQGGLGDLTKSWIGTGQNQPVTADQVQNVLGDGMVGDLAQKMGISPEAASGHLAELLPSVVSHFSPNGAVPDQDQLLSMGEGLLKNFMASKATSTQG